jgi:hypothetical protein
VIKTKYYIQTLIFAFGLSMSAAFAEVKASLEQTQVFEGDPIVLIIETSLKSRVEPDFSVLEKDFNIVGTNNSSSSRINIMTGKGSYQRTWTVKLQAKNKGKITIPQITVGNEQTEALNVNVTELPAEVIAETNKHIFVESSVSAASNDTYVQQQIPYTVKLFYDS